MNFSRYKSDLILALHFIFGMIAASFPGLVFYWVFFAFLTGLYFAIYNLPNRPAYLCTGYLAGLELLGRMSSAGLPHEFTKYAIIIILLIAILREGKVLAVEFIFFVLLLLPGMLLTDGGSLEGSRQLISGNLSGPICLAVSALYFYNRSLDVQSLRRLFLFVLYPLACIIGFLIVKTPDFDEIEFGFKSNFVTSVYGPNQMASILGLGILLIGLCFLLKIRLFGNYLVTLVFFALLLFRGLLTFSRGGMLAAAILLSIIFVYLTLQSGGLNLKTFRVLLGAAVVGLCCLFAFNYANKLTGDALIGRYMGVQRGKEVEDIDKLTSGRTLISYLDWEIFKDNPIWGVGVGMGKFYRSDYGFNVLAAAHNEFTRLLAEHGLFGVAALCILIMAPLVRFFKSRLVLERVIIMASIGFCFAFMIHSATRIAAPCFIYGLAFIKIRPTAVVPRRRKPAIKTIISKEFAISN